MKKKTRNIIFSLVGSVALVGTGLGLGLGFGLPEKDSDGVSNTDTTSYTSIGELWDAEKAEFSGDNLTALFTSITGVDKASITDIDTLASSTATAANIRTNNGGKDIVVRLGGLDWQVMYLSKDSDGNAIATLWLSNNYQDAFKGRSQTEGLYHGYYNGGLYSDWSADQYNNYFTVDYPTNMYGSSYISVVTLNNGGTYAKISGTASSATSTLTTYTPSTSSAFSAFTVPVDGENNDLTDFIVTPNKVPYQAGQNSKNNGVNQTYTLPNESATAIKAMDANWYINTTYGSASSMTSNTYYYAWTDDYLWLPSLSETGYSDSYLGIWKASVAQRQNYDGSTNSISNVGTIGTSNVNGSPTTAYNYSWLRSGYYSNASNAYSLNPSGASYSTGSVYCSQAVRPALHFNLDSATLCVAKGNWIQKADTEWNGSGTQADPYLISTAEELSGIADRVNNGGNSFAGVYFQQNSNINLSGLFWTPIGNSSIRFQGYFDGNHYSISNMKVVQTGDYAGLFGHTSNSTLTNINLKNAHVEGGYYVGGIVGHFDGTIQHCSNYADVIGINFVGGIVGTGSSISYCYNYGQVKGNNFVAGIVGKGMSVSSCHNSGDITGVAYVGGIAGGQTSTVELSTSNATITGIDSVGSIAGLAGTINNCAGFGMINTTGSASSVGGIAGDCYNLTNSSFVGWCDAKVFLVGTTSSVTISGCYADLGYNMKYYSGGDFSGYTIVSNMNNGLPMQNALYSVAIGGNTSDEVIANLRSKGFSPYTY